MGDEISNGIDTIIEFPVMLETFYAALRSFSLGAFWVRGRPVG